MLNDDRRQLLRFASSGDASAWLQGKLHAHRLEKMAGKGGSSVFYEASRPGGRIAGVKGSQAAQNAGNTPQAAEARAALGVLGIGRAEAAYLLEEIDASQPVEVILRMALQKRRTR